MDFPFYLLLFLLILTPSSLGVDLPTALLSELSDKCPDLETVVHEDTSLVGTKDAGLLRKTFTPQGSAHDIQQCVQACCNNPQCNVALFYNNQCMTVQCTNAVKCQLVSGKGTQVVVVRSISTDAEWINGSRSGPTHMEDDQKPGMGLLRAKPLSSKQPKIEKCEVGLLMCKEDEKCTPINNRRRDGFCECMEESHRGVDGHCVELSVTEVSVEPTIVTEPPPVIPTDPLSSSPVVITAASLVSNDSLITPASLVSNESNNQFSPELTPVSITTQSGTAVSAIPTTTISTTAKAVGKLVVSINNKTVYLNAEAKIYDDKVTLSAYAIGASDCKYEWTLLKKPEVDDSGSVSDMSTQTITLSHLHKGVYVFKVLVDSKDAHGEAVGNVTVLPPKRNNQAPVAIINPKTQIINLPSTSVILDGSLSTDDDTIESFHWELVSGPLGYRLPEQTSNTLQLKDLIPGNYTIELHVKDSEGLEDIASATVKVIKETDYPPTANAGGDQIIYLPKTETVIYGNTSTDDHGIVEWEWTKGPKDSGLAVDMQDTRTQFLKLSKLEEGHYQFILRVMDAANQASNSTVNVYVKLPPLTVPRANAGSAIQLTLPVTQTILDSSKTSDTGPSTHWLWKQRSGPNTAQFAATDAAKVNVSGLTKGKYIFDLTVWNGDDSSKNSTANVSVKVIQDKNVPPKASAGGDFSITLPRSMVIINGSKSTDDVMVEKWLWERDSSSLAAGKILNNSNHSPVLLLTDLVAGNYVWKLTVWDTQGASDYDSVSIIVKEGPHHLDEVEVVFGAEISSLSTSQLTTLIQKLELFLDTQEKHVKIKLLTFDGTAHAGRVNLRFLAYTNNGNDVVSGPEVVRVLRKDIMAETSGILDIPLVSVYTVVCQNNCSGHGECVEATRECRCHTWWMESFVRRHMGDLKQNCDWSVVYVFVSMCVSVLTVGLLGWGGVMIVVRRFGSRTHRGPRRKPPSRYFPLADSHEDQIKLKARPVGDPLDSGSESDSETDVLFDSRKGGKYKQDKSRNGYHKLTRIRT